LEAASWTTVAVFSQADPWLAGMPAGTTASVTDIATNQSPVELKDIPIIPGNILIFSGVGLVSHGGGTFPSGPEGLVNSFPSHSGGAENGISDIIAPYNALVGVFLTANEPTNSVAPSRLKFGWSNTNRDYAIITPLLQQVFYIGSGARSDGSLRRVVVPTGATRLFLGTMDTASWNNNAGGFTVQVQVQQNIAPMLDLKMYPGLLVTGTIGQRYGIEFTDNLQTTNAWQTLTNIVLLESPQYYFDTSAGATTRRFYRAIQVD